jgi:hypothetical protein
MSKKKEKEIRRVRSTHLRPSPFHFLSPQTALPRPPMAPAARRPSSGAASPLASIANAAHQRHQSRRRANPSYYLTEAARPRLSTTAAGAQRPGPAEDGLLVSSRDEAFSRPAPTFCKLWLPCLASVFPGSP